VWVRSSRQVDLVLVSVNIKASSSALPLVVHSSHWNDSHLVSLSEYSLVEKVGCVARHQLGGGHLYHVVIKCIHRENLRHLLLKGNLARHVPYQVLRYVELFHYMLCSVDSPCDRQLYVASYMGCPLACGTTNLTLGLALRAVLVAMAVF